MNLIKLYFKKILPFSVFFFYLWGGGAFGGEGPFSEGELFSFCFLEAQRVFEPYFKSNIPIFYINQLPFSCYNFQLNQSQKQISDFLRTFSIFFYGGHLGGAPLLARGNFSASVFWRLKEY